MEVFEELGMTGNESKVYETLLKFGKMAAGQVSKESGVSYSKIYDVLGSLEHKGLVSVIPEKSKKFVPNNPEEGLKSLIEEKEKAIEKAKEKMKEMKKFYDVKEKNPVIMGIGRNAFYKVLKEAKKGKKFAYSIRWVSEWRPDWVGDLKKVLKKGFDSKSLDRYDGETEKNVKKWLRVYKDIRKFDNKGVAMSVIEDEVFISLIKSNVTLLIRDEPFADVMKRMFLETYKTAEKIK
ncbi:MAG: helix-turn-helix domain-containing protein [archaeon]